MSDTITFKSALERYPGYFDIIDSVINKLHDWIHLEAMQTPTSALEYTKTATIIRAFNIYISIKILLRNGHWEDAAIIARSLFELLLNLEELLKDEAVSERNAKKYLRYYKLQEGLHIISNVEYEIATGRCPKERELLLKDLKQSMEISFQEFRNKKRKRTNGWENTWCGKSVYSLALSSANPMRGHQYKIIYSYFSDLSHSSPYAAMTTWAEIKQGEKDETAIQRHEENEKGNLENVFLLSTVWLMEILLLAKSQIPNYDMKWNMDVLEQISKVIGYKLSIGNQ
jgi:hypothetical protein